MSAAIKFFGGLLKDLDPIFEVLVQPGVAIALSIAILAVAALIALWFYFRRIVPLNWQIRRLRKLVEASGDSIAFATNFGAFDKAISKVSIFKHAWREFYKTLIFPSDNDCIKFIRNTGRPNEYLNLAGSLSIRLGLPSYQAIPNYFVGVGLLLTFIGLIAALYFASNGVTNPDIKIAQEAFRKLLDAATVKFMTSIAGLASSILLSMFFKRQTIGLQRRLDDLCAEIQERFEFITPEWIALDQTRVLRTQLLQLERFNTDFAVEVAQAIETRLTANIGSAIGQAVGPMVSSIDKMAENLQRQTQDGVTNLVKQFTDNLHGSAGREMEAITTALAGLEGTLEATIGRLNQSGGDFGSKLDSVAQRMDLLMANAAEKLTGSVDGSTDRLESILGDIANQLRNQMEAVGVSLRAMTEESAGALGAGAKNAADSLKATMGSAGIELSDRFRTISGRLEETLGPLAATLGSVEGSLRTLDSRLSGQFAEIERMLVRTRDLIASFDGSAERLRDAGAPIASTADKFTLAAGRIDATAGIIGQAHEQIENLTESLTQTSDRLRDSSKLYQQGTTEIDEKLGRIFSAMHDATDQYHRSISEFVTKLDGQFSSSTRLLQGGIEDLGSVVSELRDATEALKPNGRG